MSINPQLVPFIQLFVAMLFGMILGIERVLAGRTAGPRTYGLVSMGSCLLTMLSLGSGALYPIASKADPAAIVAAAVTGVGFIGAGLIVLHGSKLSGLTTAAGIWVSAAIGISVGFGYYLLAFFATFLTLFAFSVMWRLENLIKRWFIKHPQEHHDKAE